MRFWSFRNDADPELTTLDIEGELVVEEGWLLPNGAVSARDFRKRLDACGDVVVRINSPGGDVLAGTEIYNALREHSTSGKGRVTVHVTALAASAASVVAMAGDEILMNPTAYMMIHNPWSMTAGNADDLRQLADQLDEIGEGIIEAYRLKTGKSRAKLKELMDAETYMSAPTAIREGFADGLLYQPKDGEEPVETAMSAKAVSARMVARLRPAVPADNSRSIAAERPSMGPGADGDGGAGAAATDGSRSGASEAAPEARRRAEIARRAELVARSLACGDS